MQTEAQAVQALSTESPKNSVPKCLPPNVLARFILRMTLIYGHAWVSRYGDSIEGIGAGVWSHALAELSPLQIRDGIEACERSVSEWPPSIPKFRALALGIPSLAEVKHNVRTSVNTPFMPILWRFMDGYAFKSASVKDADRMIYEAYELASAAAMKGAAVESVGAIGHDGQDSSEQEKRLYDEIHMKRMAELGGEYVTA